MRRLLVIASLLALGGCTDGALDATSPMAMVRQLASANTDDDCVAKALEWGDKDHDEALTGPEFVDLTLIAFDATLRFARERLADAEANTQKRPGPAAERILAHARDDVAKAEARRQRERPRYEADARLRFERFDANHDGRLDRAELAEACSVLAHEGP